VGEFIADDITNLERYHTVTRIGTARDSFSMRTLPPPETNPEMGERVKASSRAKYSTRQEPTQRREEADDVNKKTEEKGRKKIDFFG